MSHCEICRREATPTVTDNCPFGDCPFRSLSDGIITAPDPRVKALEAERDALKSENERLTSIIRSVPDLTEKENRCYTVAEESLADAVEMNACSVIGGFIDSALGTSLWDGFLAYWKEHKTGWFGMRRAFGMWYGQEWKKDRDAIEAARREGGGVGEGAAS